MPRQVPLAKGAHMVSECLTQIDGVDCRSDVWRRVLARLVHSRIRGSILVGMKFYFGKEIRAGHYSIALCQRCYWQTKSAILDIIDNDELFRYFPGSDRYKYKLKNISKGVMMLDALFHNPPIVLCDNHSKDFPFVKNGILIAEVFFRFSEGMMSVKYYC